MNETFEGLLTSIDKIKDDQNWIAIQMRKSTLNVLDIYKSLGTQKARVEQFYGMRIVIDNDLPESVNFVVVGAGGQLCILYKNGNSTVIKSAYSFIQTLMKEGRL